MPKTLSGGIAVAVRGGIVRPIVLFAMILDTGSIFLNSSDRNLTIDGETYYGVGRLGGISTVEDTAQLQASTLRLSLSGIDPQFLTVILAEEYQGRRADLSIALLDDGYAVIDDPVLIFRGVIDQISVSVGEQLIISLTAENELVRWETPRIRRYTDGDQQTVYPEDTGLRWVAAAAEREIYWGKAPMTPPSQTGGGAPRAVVTYTDLGETTITPGYIEGGGGDGDPGDGGSGADAGDQGGGCGANSDSCAA